MDIHIGNLVGIPIVSGIDNREKVINVLKRKSKWVIECEIEKWKEERKMKYILK